MDILLSALQHYAFCPRQCALIHLEQVWEENAHTAEGRLMHEQAHSGRSRLRDGVRIATDLELRSTRLGLHGKADVVEFHRVGAAWLPYPVEYKKGSPYKGTDADAVQLCAQAFCLEEMLGMPIEEGALFYGATRRTYASMPPCANERRRLPLPFGPCLLPAKLPAPGYFRGACPVRSGNGACRK